MRNKIIDAQFTTPHPTFDRTDLKKLIKEAMEDLQQEPPRDSGDAMEAEAKQELSWAKVLDSIHPQKEESHMIFRNLMIRAISEANSENEEFLLDMLESLSGDVEIQNILMHHFESSFNKAQEV
jgi:hypothetical protein